MQAAGRGLGRVVLTPLVERFHHDLGLIVLDHGLLGRFVELEVLVVEHDVHVAGLGQLTQLERGELDLRRAAAAEHVHVRDRRIAQPLVDVARDFGDEHVVSVLGQHTRHVQRHIAVADHSNFLGVERPGARVVGVTVIPGDELGGTVGTVQIRAGDLQRSIIDGAGGENHSVVVGHEITEREVLAVLHIAEEADVTTTQNRAQRGDDALDARVVGSHAVTDQAERGGVAVIEINTDVQLAFPHSLGFGEHVGSVNARRTCSDHGNAQRTC